MQLSFGEARHSKEFCIAEGVCIFMVIFRVEYEMSLRFMLVHPSLGLGDETTIIVLAAVAYATTDFDFAQMTQCQIFFSGNFLET